MKLHTMSAALTVGVLWALCLFVMTLIAVQTGYASHVLELLEGIYPKYEVSTTGAFFGLLWGFLDGFIGTYILVAVYNYFVKKLGKK